MLSGFAPGASFHVVGIDDFLCERGYFLESVEKKERKEVCDENLPKTYLVLDGPLWLLWIEIFQQVQKEQEVERWQ
jgi:hypothetical protein